MTDFIPARIAALKEKLKAREGKKEFAESVKTIKAELARLEATGTAIE